MFLKKEKKVFVISSKKQIEEKIYNNKNSLGNYLLKMELNLKFYLT